MAAHPTVALHTISSVSPICSPTTCPQKKYRPPRGDLYLYRSALKNYLPVLELVLVLPAADVTVLPPDVEVPEVPEVPEVADGPIPP